MTLIAEIVPIQGAHVIGPLPAPLGNDTTYAAAVTTAGSAQRRGAGVHPRADASVRARRLGGGGVYVALGRLWRLRVPAGVAGSPRTHREPSANLDGIARRAEQRSMQLADNRLGLAQPLIETPQDRIPSRHRS